MTPITLTVFLAVSFATVGHSAYSGWSYDDAPNWSAKYATCQGVRQSPVNLLTSEAVHDDSLVPFSLVNFDTAQDVTYTASNNGHAALVSIQGGPLLVSGGALGGEHRVIQYHFHWGSDDQHGSEHTVDGASYPMELHVVTVNQKYGNVATAIAQPDGLAVLGFFFEISADDNTDVKPLSDAMTHVTDAGSKYTLPPVALGDMLPSDLSQYYRYQGGLTTPPCSESVVWTVFKNPILISEAQMETFRTLRSDLADAIGAMRPLIDNYRPVQPLMGREIRTSF